MKQTLKVIALTVVILWAAGLAYEALTGQLGRKTEAPHMVEGCAQAGRLVVCR